ncbi:RDD family protein [Corynebacterium variabile]|uniref:RDD family protein n=1 Tax=Corynebacterium variabile TaxID=1727 RepID=UPI0028A037AE|nr:RDD family protein [Corynebacterium variabile]
MTNPFASDDDKPDDRSADASTGSGSLPSYNAYSGGDAPDDGAPLTGATGKDAYPGPGKRLGALVIDNILIGIIGIILIMTIAGSDISDYSDKFQAWQGAGEPGSAPVMDAGNLLIASVITLVIWFVYRVVMEVHKGQTLGKMALKIKVVDADGKLLTTGASFKRNSWYIAVFLLGMFVGSIGQIVSVILIAVLGFTIARSPYRQHTFDQWSKSYVINAR